MRHPEKMSARKNVTAIRAHTRSGYSEIMANDDRGALYEFLGSIDDSDAHKKKLGIVKTILGMREGGKLADDEITAYLKVLQAQYDAPGRIVFQVTAFTVLALTDQEYIKTVVTGHAIENVQLEPGAVVLVPIHVRSGVSPKPYSSSPPAGNHWVALVAYVDQNLVTTWDSASYPPECITPHALAVCDYIDVWSGRRRRWSIRHERHASGQRNGADCGVYTALTLARIAEWANRGNSTPWTSDLRASETPRYRCDMALTVVTTHTDGAVTQQSTRQRDSPDDVGRLISATGIAARAQDVPGRRANVFVYSAGADGHALASRCAGALSDVGARVSTMTSDADGQHENCAGRHARELRVRSVEDLAWNNTSIDTGIYCGRPAQSATVERCVREIYEGSESWFVWNHDGHLHACVTTMRSTRKLIASVPGARDCIGLESSSAVESMAATITEREIQNQNHTILCLSEAIPTGLQGKRRRISDQVSRSANGRSTAH